MYEGGLTDLPKGYERVYVGTDILKSTSFGVFSDAVSNSMEIVFRHMSGKNTF